MRISFNFTSVINQYISINEFILTFSSEILVKHFSYYHWLILFHIL